MNERGKAVDTTFLSLDTAEERGFIHRDYIAHCMRWSHVIKVLTQGKRYANATIVDVGCGREAPMAKTLYSSRLIPVRYIGIDYGPIPEETRQIFHSGKFPVEFHEKTDFAAWAPSEKPHLHIGDTHFADFVTSFEVLEHVEPKHMLAMLDGIHLILKDTGIAFISTPCWDVVSCAANHVNEMRYEALGAVIEESGFEVIDVFGTFASIRDYVPHLAPGHREAFEDLRSYYDVNFLSCVFAPFYPQYSRNCLWQLRKIMDFKNPPTAKFKPLRELNFQWGSSEKWREMQR
jgi:2-polyprenyl-3-methyl-5-hydroxy-6-metoxy-1,4-benzoquinol methylase